MPEVQQRRKLGAFWGWFIAIQVLAVIWMIATVAYGYSHAHQTCAPLQGLQGLSDLYQTCVNNQAGKGLEGAGLILLGVVLIDAILFGIRYFWIKERQ